MLINAKPKLQSDIKEIFYNAAYDAMRCIETQNTNVDTGIQTQITNQLDNQAKKFALKFSEDIYEKLGEAIYDFVKEIGIQMAPSGTLIAPTMGGPVTGSTLMQNYTIS